MIKSMLSEVEIECPFCGASNAITLEVTVEPQSFYQDCMVCCQAIRFELGPLEAGGTYDMAVRTDSD